MNFNLALFAENDAGGFAKEDAMTTLLRVVVDGVSADAAKFLNARFLINSRKGRLVPGYRKLSGIRRRQIV